MEPLLEAVGAQNPYTPVCLMATVSYGTPYASRIAVVRRFRDEVLIGKGGRLGRAAAAAYYRLGAPLALWVRNHERAKGVVRALVVRPLVWLLERWA